MISSVLGFLLKIFVQFESAAAFVRPFVDSLLPDIISLMAHAKEAVRNLAIDVLENFEAQYSFSELFPSIERVLCGANVRAQDVGLVVLMDCLSAAIQQPGSSVYIFLLRLLWCSQLTHGLFLLQAPYISHP